jgi:hypothetical protein
LAFGGSMPSTIVDLERFGEEQAQKLIHTAEQRERAQSYHPIIPPELRPRLLGQPEDLGSRIAAQIVQQERELAGKLRIADKEAFLSYDQKRAEGEFRNGVSVPLLVLVIAAACTWTAWVMLFVTGPLMLIRRARCSAADARTELYEAVINGVVDTRAVSDLRATVTGEAPIMPGPTGAAATQRNSPSNVWSPTSQRRHSTASRAATGNPLGSGLALPSRRGPQPSTACADWAEESNS